MKSYARRFRLLMITLFIILMALCVGFSVFFAACNNDEKDENNDEGDKAVTTVENISISLSSLSLEVGDTEKLTVIVTMKKGYEEIDYSYMVSKEGVVSVEKDGSTLTVTALADGTVTITVTAENATASCVVTVGSDTSSSGKTKYEPITTAFDYAAAAESAGGTGSSYCLSSDYTQGIFTVEGNGKVYFEEADINTQGADITIALSGISNEISFRIVGASGDGTVITLEKGGVNVTPSGWPTEAIPNSTDKGQTEYTLSATGLEAGTYTICTTKAARIYGLEVLQYLPVSDAIGITATAATVDFLRGSTISVGDLGLNVYLDYENGRRDALTASQISTDIESLQTTEGVHEVTISYDYTQDGNSETFTTQVEIYVYTVESVVISDFSMEKSGSNYITHNVQKIYLTGGTVNYDYAAVTATAKCGNGANALSREFILDLADVAFSNNANMATAGKYTVTATVNVARCEGNPVTGTYEINVVEIEEKTDITAVRVIAPSGEGDETYDPEEESASYKTEEDGIITVATINDALQLVKLMGATDAERKFIYVGEGSYWEKVYIDIPNLSLIGENPETETEEGDLLATRSEATEIVYDAMNGVMDPSGSTTYSTVGSATVTVASKATGFYAANITFRNYWNTHELYTEAQKITSDTQADAAYINADKSYFYNVTFTGYHDTLEAENGRQVYDSCYIEGRTDFIFGSTATCYFTGCTIHSIGAGANQNNGGYVVAYKGTGNAGTVEYGYIFDGCSFEGDENVKAHSVALGRAWDKYMMMVVMDCAMDDSYAMDGYDGSSSAIRYCHMNEAPDLTRIYEYKNSGDSAIGSSAEGYTVDETSGLVTDSNGRSVFTLPSDEKAAKFADMNTIFAATNGTVNYGSAWDGKCDVIAITVLDKENNCIAKIYGTGSMDVSDIIAAINERLSDAQVDAVYANVDLTDEVSEAVTEDTTLYVELGEKDMTVPASVTYDFSTTDIGAFETSGWYNYLYVELGTGSFGTTGDWYNLKGDATIKIKLPVGATISVRVYEDSTLTVNGTVTTLTTENGEYWYTCTVTGIEAQEFILGYANDSSQQGGVCIKVIEIYVPVIYRIGSVIDLTGSEYSGNNALQGSIAEYNGVIIDTTTSGAKFRDNNGNGVQINDGTVLKIQSEPGASAEVNWYGEQFKGEARVEVDETGLITITFSNAPDGGAYITRVTIIEAETET